jgi:hypothetical protein
MKKKISDLKTLEACAEFIGFDLSTLPDVSRMPEELQAFTLGMPVRAIICQALNKVGHEDEPRWVPDFDNDSEYKYYPWVWPGADAAAAGGFGFQLTYYDFTYTAASVSARLLLRDEKLVIHMIKYFRQVLIDTMVIAPNTTA